MNVSILFWHKAKWRWLVKLSRLSTHLKLRRTSYLFWGLIKSVDGLEEEEEEEEAISVQLRIDFNESENLACEYNWIWLQST